MFQFNGKKVISTHNTARVAGCFTHSEVFSIHHGWWCSVSAVVPCNDFTVYCPGSEEVLCTLISLPVSDLRLEKHLSVSFLLHRVPQ